MWAIFQESRNSPAVMHLLKSLDNHSDTMQLAIFKNLDGKNALSLVLCVVTNRFTINLKSACEQNLKF